VTDTFQPKAGPTLAKLREALHEDADLGPARLELERRRLVAAVSSGPLAARFRKAVAFGAVAGLAAAAAALLVFFATSPPAEPDAPIRITGLVDVGAADPLAGGRTARVPPSSGAKLALADGTVLWLGADSAVSSPDGGVHRIRLEAGRALAHVARQKGPVRFVVETAYGDIEVHGTVFSLRVAATGLTVDLYEGAVRFSRGDASFDLKPGESLRVRRDGAVAARGPIDRAAVLADLLITEKTADLRGAPVPKLAPVEPEAAAVPAPTSIAPTPPAAPPAAPQAAPKRPVRKPPAVAPEPEPAAPVDAPVAPAPLAGPELTAIAVEASPPADEKLFLDAYEKAVSGEPGDARALLERYLASYPDGRYWRRVAEILGEEP